mgnify:CR=1 FL=1|tara:strand:- start:415 stop:933 length:519 start_codon:yes stop_codon:yes gene_type:complete
MSDSEMEKEIVDKGLIYPRITNDEIEAKMKSVKYDCHIVPGTTTTVVTAYTVMGHIKFTLATEIMACVDPRNFNAEIGAKYGTEKAAKSAKDKLWELEGYRLAYGIANAPGTFKDRLKIEREELGEKLSSLCAFLSSDDFERLPVNQCDLLIEQSKTMATYLAILDHRLSIL